MTIYLEVGNECWGLGDAHLCGNYAQKMGFLENLKIKTRQAYYTAELQARVCYHAKTGSTYAQIIRSILGEGRKVQLVLNTQAAWSGPIEVFFLCEGNFHEAFNVVAIAPYMSTSLVNSDKSLVSLEDFYNYKVYDGIKSAVDCLISTFKVVNASAPNMSVSFYEAGPDFSSLFDTSNTALTNLSFAIHRDPRMYDAFKLYLNNVTKIEGIKLHTYMQYVSTGACSKYGCWGLSESSIATLAESPKLRAFQDFIDSYKTCEWPEKESVCDRNCSGSGFCVANQVN